MKWAVIQKINFLGVAEPGDVPQRSFVYWEVITPGIYPPWWRSFIADQRGLIPLPQRVVLAISKGVCFADYAKIIY
jgi:hypothetical protein